MEWDTRIPGPRHQRGQILGMDDTIYLRVHRNSPQMKISGQRGQQLGETPLSHT